MTGSEIDTLVALVECGPLWDGDLPSKTGRDALIAQGLAVRVVVKGEDGWQAATYAGRDAYRALFPGPDGPAETYAADAERFRWLAEHTVATGLARWVHPFQFLGEAVDARRKLNRPPTPVGWSDTDWIAHLERLQQNEAAYARGPLPERGWD